MSDQVEIVRKLEEDLQAQEKDPTHVIRVTSEDLDTLSKNLNQLYTTGTPEEQKAMRQRLGVLRSALDKQQSEEKANTEMKQSRQKLRDELDRRFASIDNPDAGAVKRTVEAGM